MRRIQIKISQILLITVLVVGFTSANNQKKVVHKKKTESYFIITKIIDQGFRLLEGERDTLFPSFIFEFEVLNNSNMTITKTSFDGNIFIPNLDQAIYSAPLSSFNLPQRPLAKDNSWEPKTKRTIKMRMFNRS